MRERENELGRIDSPALIYMSKKGEKDKKNRLRHGYSLIYRIGIVFPPRKSPAYNADPRWVFHHVKIRQWTEQRQKKHFLHGETKQHG